MTRIEEYVAKVAGKLPRWYPGRSRVIEDLRTHLTDRVAAGENEEHVVQGMEPPPDVAKGLTEGLGLVPASIARRIGAFLVDVLGFPLLFLGLPLLVGVLAEGPAEVGTSLSGFRSGELVLVSLLTLPILALFYFPIAEATFGTTVGKHLCRLGVVVEDGTRVTWARAMLRRISFFVYPILPIDFAFFLISRTRQRAFDRVARTLVVSYPKALF